MVKKGFSNSLMVVLTVFMALGLASCSKKQVKEDRTGIEEMDIEGSVKRGPIEVGYAGGMKMIRFEFDQFNLSEEAQSVLKENTAWLEQHKTVKVQIEGHCDNRGTQEYNLALGQKRSDTVKRYLADSGIPAGRLSTISYGEERPLDSSEMEDAWDKNRRAEFIITEK